MATENPRVWFKSISLENVRSFGTKQTIYFTDDGTENGNVSQWNVILGDNGTGKTTVLKALSILEERALLYVHWFNRNDSDGKITISESDNVDTRPIRFHLKVNQHREGKWSNIKYRYGNENAFQIPFERPLVFAYGAARRIGITGITDEQLNRVNSLFDENASLVNAEELIILADYEDLKQEDKSRNKYKLIARILLHLLRNEITGLEIKPNALSRSGPPKVIFHTHYGKILLHELSLGYKTLIAWMVDFAKGLLDRYPDSENPLAEPAVCLVDEIDLHLHPKFQRTIIQFLTETFPNTQFIVTAHSPLIVQSAEKANIILLKREGNETHVTDGIDVYSWRIDQILSSDLFGGVSEYAPKTEEKKQRRRALLLKDDRTDAENHELEQLEEQLGMLTASESKEALKALELIGKSLNR